MALTEIQLVELSDNRELQAFTEGGIDQVIGWIQEQVADLPKTADNPGDRKLIKSGAYNIARARTIIDNKGKDLVADWKRQAKIVDAARKNARDTLEALQKEVRAPLTAWEAEQQAILDAEALKEEIAALWDDAHQLNKLFDMEAAEKARLEKEAAEKAEAQRQAEIKAASEAAAKAAKEEAERIANEKIAREQAAREKAEQDKRDAEIAANLAKENAARELREKEAAEKAAAERKANHARHRAKVLREATKSMEAVVQQIKDGGTLDVDSVDLIAEHIVNSIAQGAVKNIRVDFS